MTEAPAFRLAAQEYDPAIPIEALHEHPGNPNEGEMGVIEESMVSHGFYGAVLAQRSTGYLLVGNHRYREAAALGAASVPGFWLDVDDDEAARILSVDNESTRQGRTNAERLVALLRPLPEPTRGTGVSQERLLALLRGDGQTKAPPAPKLADRFLIPPFDVLDARQGWWQARKKAWLALGIRSELGRLENTRSGGRAMDSRQEYLAELASRGDVPKSRAGFSESLRRGDMPRGRGQGALYWGSGHGRSDPAFYAKKRAAEALAGRPMTTHEFEFDHYQPIPDGVGSGKSIFDPVLCELAYRWFCPPGGTVIDPFAGGSVRGLVAGLLGRAYYGCDLSLPQVEANQEQGAEFAARGLLGRGLPVVTDPAALTPCERRGGYWVKRDDLFTVGGSAGGKVRTCLAIATEGGPEARPAGLVTAGSRSSPQVNIVATVAAQMGIPCRVHVPAKQGGDTPELAAARAAGAEVVEHRPGYNTVIVKRAQEDADRSLGWVLIPFGMEHPEAVRQTARQVCSLGGLAPSSRPVPEGYRPAIRRLVVSVGSGMTLAGILHGLDEQGLNLGVLGVVVGSDPSKRLDAWAPADWRERVTLVRSDLDYHAEAPDTDLDGLPLDPIYEAKCLPYLEDGDLLWVIGCRETARGSVAGPVPDWVQGDSACWAPSLDAESADLIFTCPPYYDLEVYGEEEGELSAMDKRGFDAALADILAQCARALRPDRFAVVVTGDSRARKAGGTQGVYSTAGTGGGLRDLRGATIAAAEAAGLTYCNGAVLVTPVGSIPITAARMFTGARTLARTHQDVLVFCKGDRGAAARACGVVDVSWPEGLEEEGGAVSGPDEFGAGEAAVIPKRQEMP